MTDVKDATPPAQTVSDLGEEALLARIFPLLPTGRDTLLGPGDDAAMVAAPDGRFVVSTDVLVEGRHFRLDWSDGRAVGRRAAAQNLADVAAMGARPTSLVVSLVLPGHVSVDWVEGLARGLADVAGPVGAGVVGGDLSGGDQVVVAVTVHGDLAGRDPALRSGAQAGDLVALAGTVGRSAAGWALLAHGAADLSPAEQDLVEVYRAPRPPLDAGVSAAAAGVGAMLDLSDGLLRDAGRIARASGVVLDLDSAAWAEDLAALRPAADRLGVDPTEWVLTGGEDHGLLATFPGEVPEGFRVIGRVLATQGGAAGVRVDGRVPGAVRPGWDHFGG